MNSVEKEQEEQEEQEGGTVAWRGFRLVRPYPRWMRARVKEAWQGKTVLDVFKDVFLARDGEKLDAVKRSIEEGRLLVDGREPEDKGNVPLRAGQEILHRIHRHELIVLAELPRVLSIDQHFVAVYKPPTIPCHTTGLYSRNTILELLKPEQAKYEEEEHDQGGGEGGGKKAADNWHLLYRLDRMVAGLLVFSRSARLAAAVQSLMKGNKIDKYYLALVSTSSSSSSSSNKLHREFGSECDDGVLCVNERLGYDSSTHVAFTASEAEGRKTKGKGKHLKSAVTLFKLVRAYDDHALVMCMPVSGRTHQIRIHLREAGFPIVNDKMYGGRMPKEGFTHVLQAPEGVELLKDLKVGDFGWTCEGFCPTCPSIAPTRYQPHFEMVYLFCWKYSVTDEQALAELDVTQGGAWEYSCPLPQWVDCLAERLEEASLSLKRCKQTL